MNDVLGPSSMQIAAGSEMLDLEYLVQFVLQMSTDFEPILG